MTPVEGHQQEAGTGADGHNADAAGSRDASEAQHAPASGDSPADDAREDVRAVLERLLEAHEAYFDVERDAEFAGRRFDGIAEFHSHGESYVLVKRAKMWEVDNHEYIFFLTVDTLDDETADELVAFVTDKGFDKVDPAPNHMSSAVSLVVVAETVTDGAARLVKRSRHRESYRLGLRGWADLRVCALDVSAQRVHTNAAGKVMRSTLASALAAPTQDGADAPENAPGDAPGDASTEVSGTKGKGGTI